MTSKTIFNYSKWDNIELSDDDSDLHPNIDRDSWFRLKHRTRLEREAKEDEEVKKCEKLNEEDQARISILKAKIDRIQQGQNEDDGEDMEALEGEMNEIQSNVANRNKYIEDVREKRKWNIDNICKVTEEKTIIGNKTTQSLKASDFKPTGLTEKLAEIRSDESNVSTSTAGTSSISTVNKKSSKSSSKSNNSNNDGNNDKDDEPIVGPSSEEIKAHEKFAIISYNDFVLANEAILEKYSEIRSLDDTKDYLMSQCDILLHEHSQSYMLLSCLEDEMNDKKDRASLVCRQSQILSHIHELGTSMNRDPRDVILPFFKRIEEPVYHKAFLEAVSDFKKRIELRAIEKKKEMNLEYKSKKPIGPGGLDPEEVFESLPESVQDAFSSQDIGKLHKALEALNPHEAKEIMRKCVASGLWVPKDPTEFDT